MLALWSATGVVPDLSGATTGPFDIPVSRIATAVRLQPATPIGVGIPYGAAQWQQAFDPNDNLAYGFSFSDVLDPGETIALMERIAVSSTGAGLGLTIDQSGGSAPFIDQDGRRRIQLRFLVDPAFQASPAFDASGTPIVVAFRVFTSKSNRFDRSGVLTVRQL